LFNYDDLDDFYDQTSYDQSPLDEYPELFQTVSWQPRDAVLAWQTTPISPYPDRRRG